MLRLNCFSKYPGLFEKNAGSSISTGLNSLLNASYNALNELNCNTLMKKPDVFKNHMNTQHAKSACQL